MDYIQGADRRQLTITSLEDLVDKDSIARVIDAFINACDLTALGFTRTKPVAGPGRPGYAPGMLAKLLAYGYEAGIRSSRGLEREACRNVEVTQVNRRA